MPPSRIEYKVHQQSFKPQEFCTVSHLLYPFDSDAVLWLVTRSYRLFVTPWTEAHQAPLSMGFSRQESWSQLPCPPPADLYTLGSNTGLPYCRHILSCLSFQGSLWVLKWVAHPFPRESSWRRNWIRVSCTAGEFFTGWAIREALDSDTVFNVLIACFFLTSVRFTRLHNFTALSLPSPPPILRLIFTSVLLLHLLGIAFLFNCAEISIKTVLFFFMNRLYRLWMIKNPRSIFPISLINFSASFSKMFDFCQKNIYVCSTCKAHFHMYQRDNYT